MVRRTSECEMRYHPRPEEVQTSVLAYGPTGGRVRFTRVGTVDGEALWKIEEETSA